MYHFFGMYDSQQKHLYRQTEPTHIMENVIYNEMRMRGWLVDVGNVAQRVRNDKGQNIRVTLEVDFVYNKGSQRIYIQSAWRMPDADKMEQEKRSLRLVSNSLTPRSWLLKYHLYDERQRL